MIPSEPDDSSQPTFAHPITTQQHPTQTKQIMSFLIGYRLHIYNRQPTRVPVGEMIPSAKAAARPAASMRLIPPAIPAPPPAPPNSPPPPSAATGVATSLSKQVADVPTIPSPAPELATPAAACGTPACQAPVDATLALVATAGVAIIFAVGVTAVVRVVAGPAVRVGLLVALSVAAESVAMVEVGFTDPGRPMGPLIELSTPRHPPPASGVGWEFVLGVS